jgi:hypothetical protein
VVDGGKYRGIDRRINREIEGETIPKGNRKNFARVSNCVKSESQNSPSVTLMGSQYSPSCYQWRVNTVRYHDDGFKKLNACILLL